MQSKHDLGMVSMLLFVCGIYGLSSSSLLHYLMIELSSPQHPPFLLPCPSHFGQSASAFLCCIICKPPDAAAKLQAAHSFVGCFFTPAVAAIWRPPPPEIGFWFRWFPFCASSSCSSPFGGRGRRPVVLAAGRLGRSLLERNQVPCTWNFPVQKSPRHKALLLAHGTRNQLSFYTTGLTV